MSVWNLTPEQIEGAEFLAARKCAMLADRVGFGKTAQFVRAAEMVNARRVLVICPPVLRENELAQMRDWAMIPWPTAVAIKTGKDELPREGFVSVSYPLAAQPDMRKRLRKWRPDVLVCDEAHRIKTPRGAWTKAVLAADGIARAARHLWFVTGTPAPNDASEWYVYAKSFGAWSENRQKFIERFCVTVPGPYADKIVGNKNADELLELLRPHVISRQRIEAGRPPLEIDTIFVPGEIPRVDCDADGLDRIRLAIETGDTAHLDSPAVSTIRRLVGMAKAGPIADLCALELESGAGPMIIFCQHVPTVDTLRQELAGYGPRIIDGRTGAAERDAIKDAFQRGEIRVLICNARAAGEGLTLTAANRVILAEPSWTPDDNTQMIARAWRRGQTRRVRVSFVSFPGTIDDAITATLARKARENAKIALTVDK